MNRTTEFVLGLIGGILGVPIAFLALFIGGIGSAAGEADGDTVIMLGWLAVFVSIIGIIGSVLVKFKPKFGGVLLLLSGIVGFIAVSFFWILSGVLLIISGLMGLIRKDTKTQMERGT